LIAAGHAAGTFTVRLSGVLSRYLDTGGYFAEAVVLHTKALDAALRQDDRAGAAAAVHALAGSYWHVGRDRDALDCCERALALYRELDDQASLARTLSNLGTVRERLGSLEQ